MKKRNIIILVALLFVGTVSNAQFFKKIGKKVEKAAERAVMRKTEQKTTEKTNKALDKIFDVDFSKQADVDPAVLQKTYSYDWKYTMQIQNKKRNFDVVYYLNKEEPTTFGTSFNVDADSKIAQNMLMIKDTKDDLTLMLFEQGGRKYGQVMPSILANIPESNEAENDIADSFEYKKIGIKKILGYTCQGFEMESEEAFVTVYIALDAPVSFNQAMAGQETKTLPKNIDPKWLEEIGEDSILMEVDFVHKKKKKLSSKMVCVELKKERKNVNLSQYEFNLMSTQK